MERFVKPFALAFYLMGSGDVFDLVSHILLIKWRHKLKNLSQNDLLTFESLIPARVTT
jgi:hypothetical protein